jgi:transposase
MTGQSLDFWTCLLRLPGFVVVHWEENADQKRYAFTLAPRERIGVCPHCQKVSDEVHQTRTRESIKDLPISHYAVELKVRVPQFECEHCGCTFTPPVPFLAEGAHATERFLERSAELIRSSDVANVAAFYGVPERTLGTWYYDYLQRRQTACDPAPKPIRHLGIDELSLKKNIGSSSP